LVSPFGDQRQDLALLVGQRRQLLRFVGRAGAHALQDPRGDRRVEQRPARGHVLDGLDEVVAAHLLEDVAEAPAMIAANNASSSSYDVRISARIVGSMDRTSRHTSMPLPSGAGRPGRRRPGRRAGMRAIA
jgi:hypothetical protein